MQKKIGFVWLFTAILSIPSVGIAQPAIHWEPTLDSAQRQAGQINRPVLIYFWAPWCAVCKRMEGEVLAQPSVAAEITANYVAVKIDADHFPATARQYGVAALPTTVIATPQGQLLVSMQGRVEATEYAARLDQIATGVKQHGAVFAQMPMGSPSAATATPAAPPTTAGPPAPAQTLPSGTPPMASPALTGGTPSGTNNPSAGTPSGLSDNRYADYFRGGEAAPATPIAQPPSSLAGTANVQPPPNFGAATPFLGQSPAMVAAAPSYGSQPPLVAAQPTTSPLFSGSPTMPSPAAGTAPQLPTINPPLGLDGYCPISLSERQQWVLGDRRWGAIHRGRTYLFAGPEEQRRFFTDPDRYAPTASGNDVVLAAEQGQAVPGMRQHGVTFGNHVYLFSSEATLEKFSKNPNVYVNQAPGSLRAGAYVGQQMR